jgi:hypothetical protein
VSEATSTPPLIAPVPLLLAQPLAWKFLGVSRSAWFRLRGADRLPKPVNVPGSGLHWRRTDLEKFVAGLKPAKG